MRHASRLIMTTVFILSVLFHGGTADLLAQSTHAGADLIPVRWGTMLTASQSYIPLIIKEKGLDAKYGLDLNIVPTSSTGQQWTGLRSGDFDIGSGSVLDLLRHRRAGLGAVAIRGFMTFSNPIVAPANTEYSQLTDLAGARMGTPDPTLFGWLIYRAAGLRLADFDLERKAKGVIASPPPLLNQLLLGHQVDAAMQFSSITLEHIHSGQLREVIDLKEALEQAEFNPESFYMLWIVSESWRNRYHDGTVKLLAAIDDAWDILLTDDSVWPPLAERSGIDINNEALLAKFIEVTRQELTTEFSPELIPPTQELIDAIVDIVGPEVVGSTVVDPKAFDFESIERAQTIRD